MQSPAGYSHELYAKSFFQFGEPVELRECGGWFIYRPIPDTDSYDGSGCYPLFSCTNWAGLKYDIMNLEKKLVSLSMVVDPFGDYDQPYLLSCFHDIARPYKEHYIVDLKKDPSQFVCDHHQRSAHKGLQTLQIDFCDNPLDYLDEWIFLYDMLIQRHQIKGIARFSSQAFELQLKVPGIIAVRAHLEGRTVGITLWYLNQNIAYYHLGAYSDDGYRSHASFALFWTVISHFADLGLHWLNLGAGAGVVGDQSDGLSRFKKGWSTGTKTAFFCGSILDQNKYAVITKKYLIGETAFFPAYRLGEYQN